jgi:hypothetical protein
MFPSFYLTPEHFVTERLLPGIRGRSGWKNGVPLSTEEKLGKHRRKFFRKCEASLGVEGEAG